MHKKSIFLEQTSQSKIHGQLHLAKEKKLKGKMKTNAEGKLIVTNCSHVFQVFCARRPSKVIGIDVLLLQYW